MQLTWRDDGLCWECRFVRIGILSPHQGARITKIAATAELAAYAANIILTILRIHNLLEREVALLTEIKRRRDEEVYSQEADDTQKALLQEISQLRARRTLRTLMLVQDVADALLALSDLHEISHKGHKHPVLSNKVVLATAGLLSGCIGAYKKWPHKY